MTEIFVNDGTYQDAGVIGKNSLSVRIYFRPAIIVMVDVDTGEVIDRIPCDENVRARERYSLVIGKLNEVE